MTWNDPTAGAAQSYGGSPNLFENAIAWSADQQARLESEWRRLQRAFAYHPYVTLTPLRGDPPAEYQVDYRVTTLTVDEQNQLQYATTASVHIWLPAGFPEQPPVVRPLTGIFHPNVTWDGIYLTSAWHPSETLLNLVRKIGDLLAYRIYDPQMVINPAAMDWLGANSHLLPLDGQADFSPGVGGEPLARICRFGPASIEGMKQSLVELQKALFSQSAPDAPAVRDFGRRTRTAINLFLENDVPDTLRAAATAVDECARELPQDVPSYDYLRGRRAAIAALRASAKAMTDARGGLAREVEKLSKVVDAGEPSEPLVALKLIPEAVVLQPFQLSFPKLLADADRKLAVVQGQLNGMASVREPQVIPSDTTMGRRLDEEFNAVAQDLVKCRQEANEAVEQFEPVLTRAKQDHLALERVARWREYVDMVSRARGLERRVAEWGSEGVQAYFIENASGTFGPFQFEQPVDLGSGDLVVRNQARGQVEVRLAPKERVLGESKAGEVTVPIPPPGARGEAGGGEDAGDADGGEGEGEKAAAPKSFPTTFRLTERCDDLLVQFDFLRRQTIDNLTTPENHKLYASPAWVGHFAGLLALDSSRHALKKELARISHRWTLTMLDLAAVGPYKERLATYFLVTRASEVVPPLVKALKEAKAALKSTEKELAAMSRHFGRDVDTDRVIVPSNYAGPYNKQMALRKESGETIKRSTALLKSIAFQLMARLRDPRLLGRAGTPAMRILPPVPEALAELPLANGQLGYQIVAMEALLQTPLGGPRPEPPQAEVPAAEVPAAEVPAEAAPAAAVAVEANGEPAGDYVEGYAEGAEPAPVEAEYAGTGYAEGEYAEGQYAEGESAAEPAAVVAGEADANTPVAADGTEAMAPASDGATPPPPAAAPPPLPRPAKLPVAAAAAMPPPVQSAADAAPATAEPAAGGDPFAFEWGAEDGTEGEAGGESDDLIGFQYEPDPLPTPPAPPPGKDAKK